jgi:hypothetical protein
VGRPCTARAFAADIRAGVPGRKLLASASLDSSYSHEVLEVLDEIIVRIGTFERLPQLSTRGRAPNALAACFLLIAASILAARKVAQYDGGKRVPAAVSAIADAVRWAEEIIAEIDHPRFLPIFMACFMFRSIRPARGVGVASEIKAAGIDVDMNRVQ